MSGSTMARSITWPRPVRSRVNRAVARANAAASEVTPSARPNAGSVGGPSGSPVNDANPLIASASVPNPARRRIGPTCPNPVIRARISPGFSAERTS